jgi:hypothetical protein
MKWRRGWGIYLAIVTSFSDRGSAETNGVVCRKSSDSGSHDGHDGGDEGWELRFGLLGGCG